MKTPYSFTIIYNPKSTGKSPEMAEAFAGKLKMVYPGANIDLKATKHVKHAEKIAYDVAMSKNNPVIISVSGDGGYHEVVNGVMEAVEKSGANPICAVLPAGNANDHYKSITKRPLIEAIKAKHTENLDLLSVSYGNKKRYAHSYLGLGITPHVAIELNAHPLSRMIETWLAAKTLLKLRPLKIEANDQLFVLDSLVISNIYRMAKYLKISKGADPTDGKFEVTKWSHDTKLRLIKILLRSTLGNGPQAEQRNEFEFCVLKDTPMQLDGEIVKLKKNTVVKVSIAPGKLRTLR
jgi:diacylglycerol kinase family enzyme